MLTFVLPGINPSLLGVIVNDCMDAALDIILHVFLHFDFCILHRANGIA